MNLIIDPLIAFYIFTALVLLTIVLVAYPTLQAKNRTRHQHRNK